MSGRQHDWMGGNKGMGTLAPSRHKYKKPDPVAREDMQRKDLLDDYKAGYITAEELADGLAAL